MTLRKGPPRLQPDGIPVVPGNVAGAAALIVAKDGGIPWMWGVSQYLSGRQLDFNDLGYLERKNDYQLYPWIGYRTTDTGVQHPRVAHAGWG